MSFQSLLCALALTAVSSAAFASPIVCLKPENEKIIISYEDEHYDEPQKDGLLFEVEVFKDGKSTFHWANLKGNRIIGRDIKLDIPHFTDDQLKNAQVSNEPSSFEGKAWSSIKVEHCDDGRSLIIGR